MPATKHIFVGRKTELEQFRQALGHTEKWKRLLVNPGQNVRPRVFLPYGIGGIGKSELSRRCLKIAAEEEGWKTLCVDWDKVEYRPVERVQVMDAIAQALKSVAGEGVIKPYLDDRDKVAALRDKVDRYRAEHPEVWQKLVEVARKLATVVPGTPAKVGIKVVAEILDKGPRVVTSAYDMLLDKMLESKALKDRREKLLCSDPDIQLAHHLVKAIVDTARADALVILLDTCEVLSLRLEEFLRDSIVCPAVEQGMGLIFIVSGRFSQYRAREVEDDDGNRRLVKGYADRLTDPPFVWDLKLFADSEVADYLRECALEPTPELVKFVNELARGVPFAVQLIADALVELGPDKVRADFPPRDASEFDTQEMVTLVVQRFLWYCVDTADQDRVRTLAMLRTRDEAALRALWELKSEERPRQILADLQARYGFVQPDGSLHEVVRDFLRQSLRGEEREVAARLGQRAGEVYRPQWEQETAALPTLAEHLAENRWKSLTLDLLNALCWSDEAEAIRFLAARAVEALEFNWNFAKGLVKLAREFRDAPEWWSSRSRRRCDAASLTIEGQDRQEMTGLEALLREADELGLDQAQRCLLKMWRAKNLFKQDKASAALQICLEADKALPDDASVRQALASTFADLGNELGFKQGVAVASSEGKLAYERAVVLDSTQAAYHNGLGAMLAMLKDTGNTQLAQSSFSRAIELNPQYAAAFYNRGTTYRDLKDYPAALADYARAIELNPQDAAAFYNRGNTYAALKEYERALADFARALELDPKDDSPVYNTACAYALQGEVAEACYWLEKAIQMSAKYIEMARTDSDFDSIRDRLEFQKRLQAAYKSP